MAKKQTDDLETAIVPDTPESSAPAEITTPIPDAESVIPPVLEGYEGAMLVPVRLEGGGPADGHYRAAVPLPLTLAGAARRYVKSRVVAGTTIYTVEA